MVVVVVAGVLSAFRGRQHKAMAIALGAALWAGWGGVAGVLLLLVGRVGEARVERVCGSGVGWGSGGGGVGREW